MKGIIEWLRLVFNLLFEKTYILFWILLLINIVMKILYLDAESMWLDEASTLNWALHSFSDIFRTSLEDPNGPVFQVLLKVWISIFGISEFAARLLPAIFGSLIIWPLYLLGKSLFNKEVGFFAIILCTVSNEILFWSHELRSYTLVVFLSIWSFYYFFKILKNGNKIDIIWYWLVTTILLFTHLTASMVLIVQFFASLMYIKTKFRNVLYSYAGMAATTIMFGIWILNNNWIGGNETVWCPVPDFNSIIELLRIYFNSDKALYFVGILVIMVVFIISIKKLKLLQGKELLTVVIWGLLPIVITYIGSIYYNPRFLPKYMLYVVPGLYLSVSVFIIYVFQKRIIKIILAVILVVLMANSININPEKSEKWRKAISFHNKYKDPNTISVICAGYQSFPFSYYYNIDIFRDYANIGYLLQKDRIFLSYSLDNIKAKISSEPNGDKMILILSHDVMFDPDGEILNYMQNNYYLINSVTNLRGIRIFIFDLKQEPHEPEPDIVIDSVPIEAREYVNIFIKKIDEIINTSFSSVQFSCIVNSQERLDDTRIVISTRGDNPKNLWHGFNLKELVPNEALKYEKRLYIPDKLSDDSDIAIYVWQPNKKRKFVVNDIKISFQ